MDKKYNDNNYNRLLIDGGLFFYGSIKGNFILPPRGYLLWENIKNELNKKFFLRGVQNVILPSIIPLELLEKEKNHISGFNPECFYIERIGNKKIDKSLILRPTSEVLFYDWYRQILSSYKQLPILYNQWCSVFRAEKNTNPFFRNTEFLWQEGHTLHISKKEARKFFLEILKDYKNYARDTLNIAIISGKKTENEKFAGALESYSIECLLPDGQCLQLATSHYFGNSFCKIMKVKFQNKKNKIENPFSTSWGTSTRAIGSIVKIHSDDIGLNLPFKISPTQIAFILVKKNNEIKKYYKEIIEIVKIYRCKLYDENNQNNLNILKADKDGCPLKIIIGTKEFAKKNITLIIRNNLEKKINLSKNPFSLLKKIAKEGKKYDKNLLEKSKKKLKDNLFKIKKRSELEDYIKKEKKGLFIVPFCYDNACEEKMKKEITPYSFRCIKSKNNSDNCFFCESKSKFDVYLGRSY